MTVYLLTSANWKGIKWLKTIFQTIGDAQTALNNAYQNERNKYSSEEITEDCSYLDVMDAHLASKDGEMNWQIVPLNLDTMDAEG